MKVALAQINPTVGDLEGNSGKILDFHRQAKLEDEEGNMLLMPFEKFHHDSKHGQWRIQEEGSEDGV